MKKNYVIRLFTKNTALCKNKYCSIKCEFCPMLNNKNIYLTIYNKNLSKWRFYTENHNVAKFLYKEVGIL